MSYVMKHGQTPVLPVLKPGTVGSRLLPRRGTELAAVRAPMTTTMTLPGMDGEPAAHVKLFGDDFQIMPQVGYHFPVSAHDVEFGDAINSAASYVLGEVAVTDVRRTMVPVLVHFWARRGHRNVEVCAIVNTAPLHVIGEIDLDEAEPGTLSTDCGTFRIGKNIWPDERLLIVQEQSGRNTRIVPLTFVVRQSSKWKDWRDDTLETFQVRPT